MESSADCSLALIAPSARNCCFWLSYFCESAFMLCLSCADTPASLYAPSGLYAVATSYVLPSFDNCNSRFVVVDKVVLPHLVVPESAVTFGIAL